MAESGLTLTQLTGQQVRMVLSPLPTLTVLVVDMVEARGKPRASFAPWRRPLCDALDHSDLAALGAVFRPGGPPFLPDSLVPRPTAFRASVDDQLEQIAAVPGDELAAEIEEAGVLDSRWSVVARAPHQWRDAYLIAMRRAWSALVPLWARAAPLLDREVERVGTALARGAFGPLLDGLHPRGHVEDDRWLVDGASRTVSTSLLLAPMITTSRASLLGTTGGTTDDDGDVAYLAYPVPGVGRGHFADHGHLAIRPTGTLDALLGAPRAAILQVLDRPSPAGRLAGHMLLSPSAVTHHLIALERAGLVTRQRAGRHVLVHRTARGTSLLHLYLD